MHENWKTDNIPDLTGKVIIVTGANSGLGFEAAKVFTRQGARTIMACRSMDKAQVALAKILAEIPQAKAETMHLDLASLASVRDFFAEFIAKGQQLDVLVNNAGIMAVPYSTTEDGFESQFGTNHLGHFALTGLLIELLLKTPGSRVVTVSSVGHRNGKMDFENLNYANGAGYSPMQAYSCSKLANLLFSYDLQRRLKAADADVIAVAAHPGISKTNLAGHFNDRRTIKILRSMFEWMVPDASRGALPTIRAAVDPSVTGGQYYGPGGFMGIRGDPVVVISSEASHNAADARQLWRVSEELTGVRYLSEP